jgi:hypothetical protein
VQFEHLPTKQLRFRGDGAPHDGAAQGHSELITDLASQRSRLGNFEVVGVAGTALADKTGLGCDERQMAFASFAHGLDEREDRFSVVRRRLIISVV